MDLDCPCYQVFVQWQGDIERAAPPRPKAAISKNTRTESGTVQDGSGQGDPRLAKLVQAWPDLKDAVKRSILNLINEHGGNQG